MLGPPDGRYLLREHEGAEARWIVVIEILGAPQRRLLQGRRARRVATEPAPAPVATTRATIIETAPLADEHAARSWLGSLDLRATARESLAVLNRVQHNYRIATANPYVHELQAEDAIAVRAGYGDGEQVASGRFNDARELAAGSFARRLRRRAWLQPQERLAALLGAHDRALACEELALRARLDLDSDRPLAAVLGVRLALEAALVELAPSGQLSGMAPRLRELHELRDGVVAAANAALAGVVSDEQRETVAHALRRIEAALRARTVAGLGLGTGEPRAR